jgi:hypothetical protein
MSVNLTAERGQVRDEDQHFGKQSARGARWQMLTAMHGRKCLKTLLP